MRDIRRLEVHDALIRKLAEAIHPVARTSIFPTFRELACFAALLGFENERDRPLDGASGPLVDGRIFSNSEQALDLLYLVGLAHTQDQHILLDDKDQEELLVNTFEEFANGGFEILAEWMRETPSDPDGDKAILSALRRHGFLGAPQPVEEVLGGVSF